MDAACQIPTMEGLRMKGIGFANIQAFVAARRPEVTWEQVLEAMPNATRETARGAVAIGWYDVRVFSDVLRAVDRLCGSGDLGLMSEMGAFECEQDFSRVLRVVMRILTPSALMGVEARLWRHFQSNGVYGSTRTPDGMLTTLSDWAVDEALCAELGGYLQRLVQFTVPSQVTMTHEKCRARGDASCVYRFRWD